MIELQDGESAKVTNQGGLTTIEAGALTVSSTPGGTLDNTNNP